MTRKVGKPKGPKARCDELFSRIIRLRDKACRHCSGTQNLQCAHIISRRFNAGRTNEANAVTLCAACHHFFTDHPVAFGVWVDDWMGAKNYERLYLEVSKVTKMSRKDWEAEKLRLRARLLEFEAPA